MADKNNDIQKKINNLYLSFKSNLEFILEHVEDMVDFGKQTPLHSNRQPIKSALNSSFASFLARKEVRVVTLKSILC
jgi:hypothetical protein